MTMDPYAYQWNYQAHDPYRLSYGSPGGIPNTPSTSTWGHMLRPTITGYKGVDTVANAGLYALQFSPTPLAPFAWGVRLGLGHYSKKKAKKERDRILAERRRQVAEWRQNTFNQLANDIKAQVAPHEWNQIEADLRAALWAGGDLGDPDAINNAMMQFQQKFRDFMIARERARQAREVESLVYDPNRLQAQQQTIETERALGKQNIEQAYRLGNIMNAQTQARKGMLGSSVDIENRGALTQQRNANLLGLESGLQERARAYRLENENLKQQLLGMIYSDDPMQAQQFATALQGIQRTGELYREQAATAAQMGQVNQAAMAGYSQAFGNALSSVAPAVYIYASRGSGG